MAAFAESLESISGALVRFERALTPVRPIDLGAFVGCRIALSRAVKDFLANEWQNLPEMIAVSDEGDSARHRAIHQSFVNLRADYSRHIAQWNSDRLVRDWPGYRADCQKLILAMRRLLADRGASLAA